MTTQNWGNHNYQISRNDRNSPVISGTQPEPLLAEAMYRRFRFFILNKEKANFYRLLRVLSSASSDDILHQLCRYLRRDFLADSPMDWAFKLADKKYTSEEVIDLWFNAYYFHDEEPKRKRLEQFEKVVTENGAKIALFHTVARAVYPIGHLNYLLRDTATESTEMYLPIYCAI